MGFVGYMFADCFHLTGALASSRHDLINPTSRKVMTHEMGFVGYFCYPSHDRQGVDICEDTDKLRRLVCQCHPEV